MSPGLLYLMAYWAIPYLSRWKPSTYDELQSLFIGEEEINE